MRLKKGKPGAPRGGKAVRKYRNRRDEFPFLLAIFLFSVVLVVFSAFHLPSDEVPGSQLYDSSGSISNKKLRVVPQTQDDGEKYHLVFSTACSPFQDWQSYVFFYFALKVNQPGDVWRIASGCSPEKEKALQQFHDEKIAPMSDRFHLHFTPDFSKISGKEFKYYNKPFGVHHWLEHAMGYPDDRSTENDIFMILDPDMYLFKPLTNDFSKTKMWKDLKGPTKVTHGVPFAAKYGYDSAWAKHNLTYVAGPDSPAVAVEGTEAAIDNYAIGPPYIATGRDMYNIAVKWTEFTPRVHDIYTDFMGEMYGYCAAAAHLELPHRIATGFMISDIVNVGEGWEFIDKMERKDVCMPVSPDKLPFVFHYCQRYALGRWFVGKYKLPTDFFFNCSHPMLRVPPRDLAVKFDYYIYPNTERKDYKREQPIKQNGFTACTLIDAFNEVADYYKRQHCSNANFEKTYIFHDQKLFDELLY